MYFIDGLLAFILGSASNHRFNMALFTMTETLGTPLASNGTEDVAPVIGVG